jgi:hypothetical protein
MSKYEEANLILRLYEERREDTMRAARDWYFREFNPQSIGDFNAAIFGPHSGHLRMVVTYWDMACALVNRGAISLDLFTECNGEFIGVFMKLEPILTEVRAAISPKFAANIEKLIDKMPDGRQQLVAMRERMKAIMQAMAQQSAGARA